MNIDFKDRSMYLRGLLILISKDNNISKPERKLVLAVGKVLGFESTFCENAIDEILENEYVLDKPSIFSSSEVAYGFIQDGIRIALCDNDLHLAELEWLMQTANANSISKDVFDSLFKKYLSDNSFMPDISELEIYKLTNKEAGKDKPQTMNY